jgi:hypothetical protein
MDTKLIQQYGEDILCYRIRTARQKIRMQYKDFDKQLIQLYKEEKALHQQQRNLGWEPLIPAFQKGWKRFFVLREDIARSYNAVFFGNILAKINTKEWSHRKDFKIKKRKRGKKIYIVREQKLCEPSEYHFKKMKFSEKEEELFNLVYSFDRRGNVTLKRYVFKEPWRFVLRVRPNIIDKIWKRDELIESKIKKIDNFLERRDYRKRQSWLLRGNYQWINLKGIESPNEYNILKNKSFQQIMDESKDELI